MYQLLNKSDNRNLPYIIKNGSKIMFLSFRGIRFIDSMNFLPMSLEKFSDTFAINELKKGFFPHKFNIVQNFNYIPDKKYYQSELFSTEKKKHFDNWYELNKQIEFDFQKELYDYCKSDVLLLQEGCLQFRQNILNISGVDPFTKCITIASLVHKIYRKMNMEKESIGILPHKGFNAEQKQSRSAILWMKYIMNNNTNVQIQHSLNEGELSLGPYKLDGYCKKTNTFYEFHGCYFHGCIKCYSSSQFCNQFQKTFGSINKKHLERIKNIKRIMQKDYPGSKLVEKWECSFNYEKMHEPLLKKFMLENNYVEPLNPRDCLYGGRTNAIQLFYKAKEGEKIKYVDFTSLYPFVQKVKKFPVGHPEKITENFLDICDYFGAVKCSIIPPKKLYFPVLAQRMHGKLNFPLCSTCCKEKYQNFDCNHEEKDRIILGTWLTTELEVALQNGYIIKKIHEVWHYPKSVEYNESSKTGGLFTKQVNMFLKYKQESSGYPENVKNDIDIDNYIDNYEQKEGK